MAERMTATKANLGCGDAHREGDDWCNLDIEKSVEPDVVSDLDELPWPFRSGQLELIVAEHVFEHLEDPVQALEETARVLEPGGTFVLVFPIGHVKFRDPTHKHYWTYGTIDHIVGETDHAHELDLPFEIDDRDVDWWLEPHDEHRHREVQEDLARVGPGGWMDQVRGLAGEVRAEFTRTGR